MKKLFIIPLVLFVGVLVYLVYNMDDTKQNIGSAVELQDIKTLQVERIETAPSDPEITPEIQEVLNTKVTTLQEPEPEKPLTVQEQAKNSLVSKGVLVNDFTWYCFDQMMLMHNGWTSSAQEIDTITTYMKRYASICSAYDMYRKTLDPAVKKSVLGI